MNKKLLITEGTSFIDSAVICNIIKNIRHGGVNVDKLTYTPNTEVVIAWEDSIITVEWPIEKKQVIVSDKDNGEKCY
jgi:dTDP-4-dehydrorhamnose 3,5-epimerase-like enzyme